MFKNRPIRNKNCLWWPCLLMDRDKMSNLYSGPSIDASYQVSVHMAEGFQRRRLKCEKLTDDGRRTTSDGKSSTQWLNTMAKRKKDGQTTQWLKEDGQTTQWLKEKKNRRDNTMAKRKKDGQTTQWLKEKKTGRQHNG